jgi:hypothetical protein
MPFSRNWQKNIKERKEEEEKEKGGQAKKKEQKFQFA